MTHDDVVRALTAAYPDSVWGYDGDGSSLNPVYATDGVTLISRGLEWLDSSNPAPTLAVLEATLAELPTLAQLATGAAWVELRMIRDRWLAQTDYIDLYQANPAAFTLPDAIGTGITANSTGWQAWRQALRDLPVNVTDPEAAVQAAAAIHATSDTFPEPWPQPPAAPTIHLT